MNNATIIAFPDRRKAPTGEPQTEQGPPMKTIELVMPAAMADRIKVAAGYACKSPGQWARDVLAAVLAMEQVG